MKTLVPLLLAVLLATNLLLSGCSQTAPAIAPSQATPVKATEPPKAPDPTKAVVSQPTPAPAPAKKVDYPQKGKTITIVVPFGAGGSNDITARVLAPFLEKELGTSVQIVNKGGAGGQVGFTEIALAKPDGYTLGLNVLPPIVNSYMNPEMKAQYRRDSFIPIGAVNVDPVAFAVKADSPFKTTKDLIDYAKANPGKLRFAAGGISTTTYMALLYLEKEAGVKFSRVEFDADPQLISALLGDHVDAISISSIGVIPQYRNGSVRVLAHSDSGPSPLFPDVKPFKEQGYNVVLIISRGITVPAKTPQGIVTVLEDAIKKISNDPEYKKKAEESAVPVSYMDQKAYNAHWDQMDALVQKLLPDLLKKD